MLDGVKPLNQQINTLKDIFDAAFRANQVSDLGETTLER